MKALILLSSILFLNSCQKENVIFKNQEFKNKLDNFIQENKTQQRIIYLDIAEGRDLFEDGPVKYNEKTFLAFYYAQPNSCIGFYKSFEYKGKQILLYEFSDNIKFSDIMEIRKGEDICNPEFLIDDYGDPTIIKYYYFNEEKELIDIESDIKE